MAPSFATSSCGHPQFAASIATSSCGHPQFAASISYLELMTRRCPVPHQLPPWQGGYYAPPMPPYAAAYHGPNAPVDHRAPSNWQSTALGHLGMDHQATAFGLGLRTIRSIWISSSKWSASTWWPTAAGRGIRPASR
ncbi:hypothetical protein CPB84DRAFT_1854222 [Gymnopilus junonius]|uniref:Uncharacterized protein n=1 Tax=Gymnopilus junonius TaxID=109634 RepID=A0A9P5TGD3_GYMJU|nr:hypothetical protein CPB84DRAFT_1854222 [Gymnopilus junonius]